MLARFNDCEVSLDRVELRRAGRVVPVEPQVFDVLTYLLKHRHRVVPKTELLDEVWASRFVSESALTSRVKSARRAVGDTGRDQRVIRTVHGRGYRFVADVAELADAADPSAGRPAPGSGEPDGPGEPAPGSGEPAGPGAATVLAAVAAVAAVGRGSGAALQLSGPGAGGLLRLAGERARAAGLLVGESQPGSGRGHLPSALADWVQQRPDLPATVPEECRADLPAVLDGRLPGHRQRRLLAFRELLTAATASTGAVLVLSAPDLADPVTRTELEEAARVARRHPLLVVVDGSGGDALDRFEQVPADDSGERASSRLQETSSETPSVTSSEPGEQTGDPAEVASRLVAAGRPGDAVEHVLSASRPAAAAGDHARVLRWTEVVRRHAEGPRLAELLALRADALAGTGHPTAVAAYRQAVAAAEGDTAGLRARMAWAAVLSGDMHSAEEAMAGISLTGGHDDVAVQLSRGLLAYFSGDLDAAEEAVEAVRPVALAPGAPDRLLNVITLQGMIAHHRGRWFDRLRQELRAVEENPRLASVVFDSHLCVAEFLLYGPTPYDEVVALAEQLRQLAEAAGARRGTAFAVSVAGEAALLAGDLDTARARLTEAADLHQELGGAAGTAHALQRLAEVELAAGDRADAELLLRRALVLARWSPLSGHLLQRVYGTLIAAAPDSETALATVDEAVAAMDEPFACVSCQVMVAVPAAVACIDGGRLADARDWLGQAKRSAASWQGTAWQGAVTEAEGYLARAEGDEASAERLLRSAADLFTLAGQPLDSERCREAAAD